MKKGFTLIELLAVIVILAIIALIATPIILGIINDAKEDSNKRSIENYAHAVELAVARYAADKGGVIPVGEYTVNGKELINKDSNAEPKTLEVDYKGDKITGDVSITSDSKVVLSQIKVNGSSQIYDYSEKDGVTSGEVKEEGENEQASSPFKVTNDGLLIHYERQGNETSVIVPAEVNGIKIKSIAPYAFMPGDIIVLTDQSLVVGLTDYAEQNRSFASKYGMEFVTFDELKENDISVNLPESIGSSGEYMKGIMNLSIPDDVRYNFNISDYYLIDLDLSNAIYLEVIGNAAFRGVDLNSSDACYSSSTCPAGPLDTVKLPMNGFLTTIGRYAFYGNQLTEMIIPESVESIGDSAFGDNQKLTSIMIKRANSDGMTLESSWNGSAEVVYDPS